MKPKTICRVDYPRLDKPHHHIKEQDLSPGKKMMSNDSGMYSINQWLHVLTIKVPEWAVYIKNAILDNILTETICTSVLSRYTDEE